MYRKGKRITCKTERALDAVRRRANIETDKIANDVRKRYVIPFCKKHGMRFIAGMGSWSFHKPGQYPLWNDDNIENISGSSRMLEALRSELPTNPGQALGSIIESYEDSE